jgi:hypothetical protein
MGAEAGLNFICVLCGGWQYQVLHGHALSTVSGSKSTKRKDVDHVCWHYQLHLGIIGSIAKSITYTPPHLVTSSCA